MNETELQAIERRLRAAEPKDVFKLLAEIRRLQRDRDEFVRLSRGLLNGPDVETAGKLWKELDDHLKGNGYPHIPEPVVAQVLSRNEELERELKRLLGST